MEPDRLEKGIRFGCGATMGLLLGFVIALKFLLVSLSAISIFVIVGAIGGGVLAVIYGDYFWRMLPDWLKWLI